MIVLLEELPAADRQRVIKTVMAHFSGDLPPQQQHPDHNQPRPQTSRGSFADFDPCGPAYGAALGANAENGFVARGMQRMRGAGTVRVVTDDPDQSGLHTHKAIPGCKLDHYHGAPALGNACEPPDEPPDESS